MAQLSIDDLITPVTEDQVLEIFLLELETLGLPARSWRKGGVARTILRVVAKTYAGFAAIMAEAARSSFLELARGSWLTLLAWNVFGVERREATFASGQMRLVNAGGGVFPFDVEEVRFLRESDGKAYTNTEAFTLNPGETKLVEIQAVERGSDSSAGPDTIQKLETTLLGVTCTNPDSVVGSDAESDDELRAACRNKLAAISVRGPRGAYAYAVRAATRSDGTPVDINRSSISPSSSTGTVTVYVASPSGTPATSDIDLVKVSIDDIARPDSVTAFVLPVVEVPFSRQLTVWAKRTDGVSADDVKGLVEDALVKEVSEYPIGGIPKTGTQGYLYSDFIKGVAKSAHASVYDCDLDDESDLALAPGEVATLASLVVEVRIVEVS